MKKVRSPVLGEQSSTAKGARKKIRKAQRGLEGVERFDSLFSCPWVELPTDPGVYRFFDSTGAVIYVGKAKNLKRRLGQYRRARRVQAHFKMRQILSEAVRGEFEILASDHQALVRETELIQELRPKWNVVGAFFWMYPLIGVRKGDSDTLEFCLTQTPDFFSSHGFLWAGAFRSKGMVGGGFFALMELLSWLGHRQRRRSARSSREPKLPKWSYWVRIRGLNAFGKLGDAQAWVQFFRGEDPVLLEELVLALVENRRARSFQKRTQHQLNWIKVLWRHEILVLQRLVKRFPLEPYPISQRRRDLLFIERKFQNKERRSSRLEAPQ